MPRRLPNIVVTGTPGVGKTTTSSLLVSLSADTPYPLKHLAINDIVKKKQLHEGYDERLQTLIVDEDKVLDELETLINDGEDASGSDSDSKLKVGGGWLLDWHVCDLFPERWVDLVVVLRCPDTGVFHDRLADTTTMMDGNSSNNNKVGSSGGGGRGYEGEKLQENIDAEIFGVIAEEAKEAYPGEGKVVELDSVNVEDVDSNCERIIEWVEKWMEKQKGTDDG